MTPNGNQCYESNFGVKTFDCNKFIFPRFSLFTPSNNSRGWFLMSWKLSVLQSAQHLKIFFGQKSSALQHNLMKNAQFPSLMKSIPGSVLKGHLKVVSSKRDIPFGIVVGFFVWTLAVALLTYFEEKIANFKINDQLSRCITARGSRSLV